MKYLICATVILHYHGPRRITQTIGLPYDGDRFPEPVYGKYVWVHITVHKNSSIEYPELYVDDVFIKKCEPHTVDNQTIYGDTVNDIKDFIITWDTTNHCNGEHLLIVVGNNGELIDSIIVEIKN